MWNAKTGGIKGYCGFINGCTALSSTGGRSHSHHPSAQSAEYAQQALAYLEKRFEQRHSGLVMASHPHKETFVLGAWQGNTDVPVSQAWMDPSDQLTWPYSEHLKAHNLQRPKVDTSLKVSPWELNNACRAHTRIWVQVLIIHIQRWCIAVLSGKPNTEGGEAKEIGSLTCWLPA